MVRGTITDPDRFELASVVTKNSRCSPALTQPASHPIAAS